MPAIANQADSRSQCIPLTAYDNIMPRIYLYTLYILQTGPNIDPRKIHARLETSLAQTVADMPFLGGKVYEKSRGRLELELGDKGNDLAAKIMHNDIRNDVDLDDLLDEGIPDEALDGKLLLPTGLFGDLNAGADVLVCQANYIQGGCILAVGIFHSVCDGAGNTTVMKVWTDHLQALGAQEDGHLARISVDPKVMDKNILGDLWRASADDVDDNFHEKASEELWRFLGVDNIHKQLTNSSAERTTREKMVTGIFYISKDAFAALKAEGSSSKDETGSQVTANDALMAFLWQSTMRARFTHLSPSEHGQQTAILDSTVDARSNFSSRLPPAYIGNVVLMNTASMPLQDLVAPGASVAGPSRAVREALNTITTQQVQDSYSLARSLPSYNGLTFPFATFEGCELCITSVVNNPAFQLSFGPSFANGGRPLSVRPPRSEFADICRRCVALPMRTSGGFEILIAMFESEMKRLMSDESFTRFARFSCN